MKREQLSTTGDLVGSVLLGRYRVVRELAKGGMGVVYLARAEGAVGFVKPVVVKLVLQEHADDERIIGMFVREAQILAQLRHPSVVSVLEFGEQDGAYVLVLEYVRGYHLGQWTRYLWLKKRQAAAEILLQVIIDVLEALHHAHNQTHPDGTPMQIVHRDVSPSNILLDEDGRARLLDFGVARMRGGPSEYKTQVQGFMGKLPYTAPEMFAGGEASPRSDLYACGVMLHEVLLGENVFRTENQASTLHKIMTYVPEPLEPKRRDLPAGVDAVLAKALAKSPDDRYPDARAFAAALRKLQHEQESDVRARHAALLKQDFGTEMADLLALESLADRDEAWRRLSQRPPKYDAPHAREASRSGALRTNQEQSASGMRAAHTGGAVPPPPPAVGVTQAAGPHAFAGAMRRSQQFPAVAAAAVAAPAAAAAPALAPPPPRPPQVHTAPLQRAPQAARNLGMLFGLIAVGALAVAAIVVSLLNRPVPMPPPAAPAGVQNIRIVSQANDPAPAPAAAPAAAPQPVAPVPEPAEVEAEPARESESEPERGAAAERKKRGRAPDARALTLALRKQQPKIHACFTQHAGALDAHPGMQLEFDVDARGKITRLQVQPAALAPSPLGQCLARVGRQTDFPAQGQPVSFAIPVTASRGQ